MVKAEGGRWLNQQGARTRVQQDSGGAKCVRGASSITALLLFRCRGAASQRHGSGEVDGSFEIFAAGERTIGVDHR